MLNVQAEIIKMESPQVAEAFMRFKPMCDSFLKQPQRSVLVSLIKLIKSLPNEVIQDLHTYLMFPFVVHLRGAKENFKDDMKAALADGVYEILSKIQLGSLELFHKYYSLLIYQIFDRTTPNTVAHIDEDCALSFIRAITALTLRITQEVRNKLYTRSKAPEIGQGIYLSVQIARSSSYKPLKIAAIHCIMALTTVHDDLIKEELDNQYVDRVGEVLMFFLPGLLGGLQEVAMGNPKQGHTVTCLAIRGINNILCLVMHDRESESNAANITDQHFIKLIAAHKAKTTQETPAECDPFGKKLRHKGHTGMLEHLESAKRDDDWYKAAANRLLILIRSLKPLQNHDHEKVRLELAFLCWNIISCCIINMQPSLRDILEMLVAMSENDMEEVRRSSDKALEEYSKKIKNGKLLLSHLEENFYNDLSKLPRCLNALETREHIAGLNLLKGYVRLLTSPKYKPQKLTEILSSSFILNRLVFVLIEVFKMECSGIKILEDFSVRDVEFEMMQTCPWKVFKNLQNEACVKIALEICQILGASEAVEMVADSLLEQLRESEHKKEIILVLNELLSSPVEEKDLKEHLVENLINTYIDIEMWYMPIVVCRKERPPGKHETLDVTVYNPREWIKERTFDLYEGATETRYTDLSYRPDRCDIQDEGQEFMTETCKTIAEAQDNVIKICLMTEGIGKMALFLGVEFDKFLLKTLYLVLERAGSSNEMIHLAGLKALSDITKACKMKDVTELIKQNADYFTHHVNLKLRRISENIGVLDVLLVVMRYSETAVLPCLYEIVDNVLDQCVDVHQHSNMILFLRLFFTFIKYIKTKFPSNETVMERQQNPCLNSIIEQIMDYHYNKCKSTNFNDEDSNKTAYEMYKEDNMEIVDEETEDVNITEKKTPPIHITMVVSILKKALNFIPSNDREQKILALSILKEGIGAIKDWEDELLPLVHLVWSPLVNRFRETSQPIIINRSFQLLLTLAEYSKDFIRTRTLKEVMPILCNILVKSASDSHMKDIGSTYRFTQSYKLQLALLEGMGHLCLSLNLQEREIYKVVNAVTIYLTCKQPKPLQLACMNMFKLFMDHDPAPIWLHLNGLWNEQENVKPPNDLFTAFTCVLADPQKKLDYQQNVRLLLEYHKGNQMDETQQEEIKEEEMKTDEIKQEEVKAGEIKQGEINTDKIKQEEVKPDQIKQEGIKPDEIKHEEVKPDEIKQEGIKPDEIKQEETNLDETEAEGNL